MLYIGIDPSKRSTALVCIDAKGDLVDYLLSSPLAPIDNEALIIYINRDLERFLQKHHKSLAGIAIEGLSFGSIGASKDILAGIFWALRVSIFKSYPGIPLTIVPVSRWRSKVLSIEERREITKLKIKDGLKKGVVDKLPVIVKAQFEAYIHNVEAKKTAIYDLADSYFIAEYLRLHGG